MCWVVVCVLGGCLCLGWSSVCWVLVCVFVCCLCVGRLSSSWVVVCVLGGCLCVEWLSVCWLVVCVLGGCLCGCWLSVCWVVVCVWWKLENQAITKQPCPVASKHGGSKPILEDDQNLVLVAAISLYSLVGRVLSKREVVGSNPTGGSMAIATDHAATSIYY